MPAALEALPELVWFALLFFCFAFVYAARKLIAAMFQPVFAVIPHIPYVGSGLGSFLHSIEQDIDGKLGEIEHGIDALMGRSFHAMARLAEWQWDEIRRHAHLIEAIVSHLNPLSLVIEHLRGIIHALEHPIRSLQSLVKAVEHAIHSAEQRIKRLEHDFAHGIGDDVLPRLKTLDREVDHLESRVIPSIRAAEREADAAISNLYEWAKGKANVIGIGTFAGAVAAVLAELGFDALKCTAFGNLFKKRGCNLWSLLDDLLGLVVSGLLLTHVCDLLPLLEDAFGAVVGPLVNLLNDAPLGACEKPPKGWASLNVAMGPLPPAQTLGPIPS